VVVPARGSRAAPRGGDAVDRRQPKESGL